MSEVSNDIKLIIFSDSLCQLENQHLGKALTVITRYYRNYEFTIVL